MHKHKKGTQYEKKDNKNGIVAACGIDHADIMFRKPA